MNQSSYLAQSLWEYRDSFDYTDITLVCVDGTLAAHSAMLAGFFTSFGISFSSIEDVPECLLLPDLTTSEVKQTLEAIYLQSYTKVFPNLLERTSDFVKQELSVYGDDTKANIDSVKLFGSHYNTDSKKEATVVNNHFPPFLNEANEDTSKLDKFSEQDDKEHKCHLCNKIFKKKCHLTHHLKWRKKCVNKTLQENLEYRCHICTKTFKHKSRLTIHLKRHYGIKRTYKFKCTHCVKGFQNEESFKKHTLDDHSGMEYICSHCPLKFKSREARQSHEYRQHAEKTISCGQCGRMFPSEALRNSHINKIHIKINNKMCNLCGERFSDKATFEAHVNRHTDYRPFECDICQKTFLIKSHLFTHYRVHTLPYKCEKCLKGFNDNGNLKRHIRKDHEGLKSECRFGCGWEAAHARAVYRHEIQYCKLNPVPNAPYTIAMGTANKLALQRFHARAKK